MEGLKTEIDKKREEYDSKTLWGVLKIIGGIGCFALTFVAPFLSPLSKSIERILRLTHLLIIAAATAGVGLIYWGVKDLIDRGEVSARSNLQLML